MRAAAKCLFPAVAAAAILIASPPVAPVAERFSWQRPQARITATGDLEWAPQPFVFMAGQSVRYIDYAARR